MNLIHMYFVIGLSIVFIMIYKWCFALSAQKQFIYLRNDLIDASLDYESIRYVDFAGLVNERSQKTRKLTFVNMVVVHWIMKNKDTISNERKWNEISFDFIKEFEEITLRMLFTNSLIGVIVGCFFYMLPSALQEVWRERWLKKITELDYLLKNFEARQYSALFT